MNGSIVKLAPKPLPAQTELRQDRQFHRVRMQDVSQLTGIPISRLSQLERDLVPAKPGEVDRIREAIRRIARVLESAR